MLRKFHSYPKHRSYREKVIKNHIKQIDIHTIKSYFQAIPLEINHEEKWAPELNIQRESSNEILLGIHPGASRPTKQWPLEYLVELIYMIEEQKKWKITVFAGPGEEEMVHEFYQKFPHLKIVGPDLSLEDFILQMSRQSFFLVNDSGPMHIAQALNLPFLCLYGATHPSLGFFPYRKNGHILSKEIECCPCSLHGDMRCPRGHFRCMKEIFPNEVFNLLSELISDLYPNLN